MKETRHGEREAEKMKGREHEEERTEAEMEKTRAAIKREKWKERKTRKERGQPYRKCVKQCEE